MTRITQLLFCELGNSARRHMLELMRVGVDWNFSVIQWAFPGECALTWTMLRLLIIIHGTLDWVEE